MENLYIRRGGEGKFNLSTVALLPSDLDDLEEDVLNKDLPHTEGFFFGESKDYHIKETLDFIKVAREKIKSGHCVYYTSWW
jgi:hypothetical protein